MDERLKRLEANIIAGGISDTSEDSEEGDGGISKEQ